MDDLEARLATGLTRGTAHVVFFLDEEFVIRWVSPSAVDMTGWPRDQMIGRSGLHFIHPDDLGDIGRLVFSELQAPHEYGADPARRTFDEIRLATVDGTWKAFEFAANNLVADPEVRGFVVIARDITERRMQDDVWDSVSAGSPIEVTAELVAHLLSWQSGGAAVTITLASAASAASTVPITVGEPAVRVTPVVAEIANGAGTVTIHHPSDPEPSTWVSILAERAAAMIDAAIRQTATVVDERLARLLAGLEQGLAYVTAITDPSMTIEWISPSVRGLTGWSPDELIGRNAVELVHADDIDGVLRILAAEAEAPRAYDPYSGSAAVNRLRFRTADGGWRAFDIGANNRTDDPRVRGFVFVLADAAVAGLVDEVYDSMIRNRPVAETAGCVARMLAHQSGGSLVRVHLEDDVCVEAGRPRAGAASYEVPISPAGTLMLEHDADSVPSEWLRVLSERAAGLVEIAIARELGERDLRRRLDEKTAIIAAVSHDLRSPIAAIQLMSTLLDHGAVSPVQQRELAARIALDARRTSRLLADLTSVDRMLRGDLRSHPARASLRTIVAEVLADLDVEGRAPVVLGPADVSAVVDAVLTGRIVDNLVGNALKYTPLSSRIEVAVSTDGVEAVIDIDDDGPGVPVEARDQIFAAYARGDEPADRPGSGMGLFLARTFAEVQHGTVTCEQSPLGGARFRVRLPLAPR